MLLKKLQLIFILFLFGLGLSSCGDNASESSSDTSQSAASNSMEMMEDEDSGMLEAYDPDVPSMMVEDNNVIYQEEIYQTWPQ